MTAPTFRPRQIEVIRQDFGFSRGQFGYMLGFEGTHANDHVFRIETGLRRLREPQARLLQLYLDGYRPPDWGSDGYSVSPYQIADTEPREPFDWKAWFDFAAIADALDLPFEGLAHMLGTPPLALRTMTDEGQPVRAVYGRLIHAYLTGRRPADWGELPSAVTTEDTHERI